MPPGSEDLRGAPAAELTPDWWNDISGREADETIRQGLLAHHPADIAALVEHLPLEDLVAHYEKGSAYLTRCEAILQSARGRIELITLRNRNEIALDADAKSSDGEELSPPDEPDDDNDIRLF